MPSSKKITVAIIMGGRSSEHDVSLKSGEVVASHLSQHKYNILKIVIQKDGNWTITRHSSGSQGETLLPGQALDRLSTDKVDVVFLALHGTYGEDGTIQGMLEMAGIPYTGSNVLSSSLAMNKIKTLEIYEYYGFKTPRRATFTRWDTPEKTNAIIQVVTRNIHYPCFVKPVQMGSSVATFKVENESSLQGAIKDVVEHDVEGLIEEFIQGDEVTCAVLGGAPGELPRALPPTMIVPRTSRFFDYTAKYTPGATEEITPAPIGDDQTARIQTIAVKVHQILGCGSMSRTDMIIRGEDIYLLETNTIPGMTETSLYPQAAKAAGMTLEVLFDRLVELALLHYQARQIKI